MKITFVNRMMGIKFGGGENFDFHAAKALKDRGHEVRFVIGTSPSVPEPLGDMLDREFEVIRIHSPYLRSWHYRIGSGGMIARLFSSSALELDLWFFERRAQRVLNRDDWSDIFQLCSLPRLGAWLAKRNLQTKRKIIVRWPGPPSRRKVRLMGTYDFNIANGDAWKVIQKDFCPEVRKIDIGVDISRFVPSEEKFSKLDGRMHFLFVGRLVPVKNLPMLLDAFFMARKNRDDIVLHIVGEGERKRLEHFAEKTEGSIVWHGELRGEELAKFYQRCDCFCLSSSYDNFPNVVLEAMASGLPVIATRVGGIPDQVEEGETGILVDSGDVKAMSDAILTLTENPHLRTKMGHAARKRVEERFSWDQTALRLEKLYQESRECVE